MEHPMRPGGIRGSCGPRSSLGGWRARLVRLAVSVGLAAAACDSGSRSGEDEPLIFPIGDVRYVIPGAHVDRHFDPGRSGWQFIVLRPDGPQYKLQWDELAARRMREASPRLVVDGVNDARDQGMVETTVDGVKVVCRPDDLHYNCGLTVWDAGVTWSLVFDKSRLADAPFFARRAADFLASYRQD